MPQGDPIGYTRVFGREFTTTGVLGTVDVTTAAMYAQGFPAWLTVPSHQWLVDGARVAFLLRVAVRASTGFATSATRRRAAISRATCCPTRADLRGIGASIVDHLRFRHPTGEAAKRYNVLQKLAYLGVIFVLLPLIILMGFGDVAAARRAVAGLGRLVRRPPVGAHDPFHRRVAARRASC